MAELAADGLTNREIAQAFFVTARTVEGHLTQVFRKLDLSAREELAGALAPGPPGAVGRRVRGVATVRARGRAWNPGPIAATP